MESMRTQLTVTKCCVLRMSTGFCPFFDWKEYAHESSGVVQVVCPSHYHKYQTISLSNISQAAYVLIQMHRHRTHTLALFHSANVKKPIFKSPETNFQN